MKLFVPLDPILASNTTSEHGPFQHPEFCSPELQFHRVHTVSCAEMDYESWVCEVYMPFSSRTCIENERQLTSIRNSISVCIVLF